MASININILNVCKFHFCFYTLISVIPLHVMVNSTITAAVGQNVTLPCQVLNYSGTFNAVMWNRPDLEKNHYVFLFKDGHIDPEDQHDIYKNRVQLKDRTMKDGDVSLILKNVTFNDRGKYECFIQRETNNTDTDNNELITSISLSVVPPGHVGLSAGLTVAALVGVGAIFGVVMFLRHQKKKKNSPPPAAPEPDMMLI
uniref:Ig-like domain-containing protein n=1 Tax=Salarias fasciatus TaxID=181472 RepID=A0A672F286_SALFA